MANEKRLIYLGDAIEKIVNFPSKVAHDAFYGRKQFTPMQMLNVVADRQHEIIDLLETVKEVDTVEVVRCKECKHYGWEQEPCHGRTQRFCKLHKGLVVVDKYTFCSYGERRTDER